mmetsp:Transcript_26563/g.38491  ORF Transcript_26563/g.38491 Transcript_26563/m.38491 type:complete len:111 (-) Transcript_26563:636-968(-)
MFDVFCCSESRSHHYLRSPPLLPLSQARRLAPQLSYYRVPFVQALELVSKCECYVEKGQAYVPLVRIVSIVAAKFRVSLSKSLALAACVFGQVAHDEASRIGPSLKSMNS